MAFDEHAPTSGNQVMSKGSKTTMFDLFREIGWRINLDAIHRAFLETISVFPDPQGAVYEVHLMIN